MLRTINDDEASSKSDVEIAAANLTSNAKTKIQPVDYITKGEQVVDKINPASIELDPIEKGDQAESKPASIEEGQKLI